MFAVRKTFFYLLFVEQRGDVTVWKCHHRNDLKLWTNSGTHECSATESLSADPCENACPSAYAYISLLYTFNYNTVPVPFHTHRDSEKAESFFPCYANNISLKTV